jgi:protein-L-isoaspartate O-methyltransferase
MDKSQVTFLKQVVHATILAAGLLAVAGSSRAVEIAAPYVPTAPSVVDRMLEIAKVGPNDYVIDLGSGDGRIVITAAKKYGASGFGVEIDPQLVARANANARAAGVSDRARFYKRDLFATDLSKATVVTIYLLTRATMKLQSRLFDLKPGTRIVSHAGSMGEWRSDHFQMLDVKDKVRPDAPKMTYIYLWVVPSKVAGHWRWSMPVGARTHDYELMVSQQYQNFSGTLRVSGREISIEAGKLNGDRITLDFKVEVDGNLLQHRLVGRVAGHSIVGTATVTSERAQREAEWKAFRVATPESAVAAPAHAPAK